jgi:hypothetical protein
LDALGGVHVVCAVKVVTDGVLGKVLAVIVLSPGGLVAKHSCPEDIHIPVPIHVGGVYGDCIVVTVINNVLGKVFVSVVRKK